MTTRAPAVPIKQNSEQGQHSQLLQFLKRHGNLDFRAEKLIAFPKQNMQYISGVKVDGNDK